MRVSLRKRRDPDNWETKVETLCLQLAVIHYNGLKEVIEDTIPITRQRVWRLNQLRVALGETLPT